MLVKNQLTLVMGRLVVKRVIQSLILAMVKGKRPVNPSSPLLLVRTWLMDFRVQVAGSCPLCCGDLTFGVSSPHLYGFGCHNR